MLRHLSDTSSRTAIYPETAIFPLNIPVRDSTTHTATIPKSGPPYEPNIDFRYPMHFDGSTIRQYQGEANDDISALFEELEDGSHDIAQQLSVCASADLVTAVTPFEHAMNPYEPRSSPPYFRIDIWEEHIERWPEIHETFRKLIEMLFPLAKFPELGQLQLCAL